MQLRSYVLYAGSSLWISPSKCLGLEPKWHCHFGIPRQTQTTLSCLHPNGGAPWGFVGVDSLKPSTWYAICLRVASRLHSSLEPNGVCRCTSSHINNHDTLSTLMVGQLGRGVDSFRYPQILWKGLDIVTTHVRSINPMDVGVALPQHMSTNLPITTNNNKTFGPLQQHMAPAPNLISHLLALCSNTVTAGRRAFREPLSEDGFVSVCLCPSLSVSVCLCLSLSVSVCLCLSLSVSICLSACLTVCLSVCLLALSALFFFSVSLSLIACLFV